MVGKIKLLRVIFAGHDLIDIDSPAVHDFTFIQAMFIFINFEYKADLERVFNMFSENGEVIIPLDNYGFRPKFGWIQDHYGIPDN